MVFNLTWMPPLTTLLALICRLYTDFTNFTDKLKTEFLISWAAWTLVRWGPQRDCGRAWWGEKKDNSILKKNSSSEISSHFNQYWCIIIRMAPELWTLKNSVRWWWPHSTSRKEKSISRRRDANCWHRNDFNTCNHDSNTKKQQGESQYRTLIFFRKLDFCCWD